MSNTYLIIHMSDPTGTDLSQSEDQAMLERWAAEGEDAGRLGRGGPVAGPERAKSVAVREGRTLVTDGPFPEFKEWFAGYDLITADSIDEAAEYMAKHPVALLGRIYILPLVKLPWDRE
ncbi:YciI family protein [Brachybacterium hainanense]|uniref:YciI family protein n=1 Tax=Brachybacterium hainanense TaxID=1541174 RepID=A0ABV6R9X0_9MICO